MSKPIKLTEEMIQELTEEFKQHLIGTKMFDGKVEYSKKFTIAESEKVNVVFSNLAFTKMLALVMTFDDEVAWHGTVERDDDTFYITDIMVYPQEVTGATVNTDQDKYTAWLYEFDDEVFNSIRFQGHSHVNMGVTPSSTDLNHQEALLSQLTSDDFYIFLIMNKKMNMFVRVYDLETNRMYDTEDIRLFLGHEEFDMHQFTSEAKEMVKRKNYTTYSPKSSKGKKKYEPNEERYTYYY